MHSVEGRHQDSHSSVQNSLKISPISAVLTGRFPHRNPISPEFMEDPSELGTPRTRVRCAGHPELSVWI